MLPWYGWLILSLLALFTLMVYAAWRFRGRVRAEFLAHLAAHRPDVEVVEANAAFARLRVPGADVVTFNFLALYQAAAEAGAARPQARVPIYEQAAAGLGRGLAPAARALTPAADAGTLLPRLVPRDFFDLPPEKSRVPHFALPGIGLYVVYVMDGSSSVAYLTREHQVQLGMSDDELLATATENLRARSPDLADLVRAAAERGAAVSVKTLDTFDAARLLLVPDLLRPGESLVAAVPDRDTLALAPVPADDAGLADLAPLLLPSSDKRVLGQLLRVTSDGIGLC